MTQPYAIERELGPGEKLLWKGKPKGGLRLCAGDAFVIPFSIFWGWGFLSGFTTSDHSHPPDFFIVPFAAVAFYFIIGRFFVDIYMRARTEYVLTNERAIIVTRYFAAKTQSFVLKNLVDVTLSEAKNGSGTIAFNASASPYGKFNRNSFKAAGLNIGASAFEMIPDVRRVDGLIKSAQMHKSDL